ncbi:cysteine--tRNA ligase [Candidatus Berkelbacteria bacterium]|nr:cysteine--tRNA ligase [Candidatus Berkelbacteria bacterium]
MDIHLFNSRTHALERFQPIKPDEVGIYTCGPTVYQCAHLGNLRAYVVADLLRRMLEYGGYATKHVMNITDVGHLIGDGDEGEDKVEQAAQEQGKSAWEIASLYTDAFLDDTARLNVAKPHIIAKATAHIPEQIALIKTLEEKGYTYRTSDGIYFDTSKFPSYGPLTGQAVDELQPGARVEVNPEKRHGADFALWKLSERDGDTRSVAHSPSDQAIHTASVTGRVKETHPHRQMEWESPWGVGFPGWHIECSAMSTTYLGQPFDIHTGGIDHLQTHHPNEIAQSEAAAGVPLAHFWLHSAFMTVDGVKMAKSIGNVFTLQDVVERGYDPLAFRYLLLGTHYRKPLNFTWESLAAAGQGLSNLRALVRTLLVSDTPGVYTDSSDTPEVSLAATPGAVAVEADLLEDFRSRIADDLGFPQALALLWDVLKSDRPNDQKVAAVAQWDQVLSLGLATELGKQEKIPADVEALAAQREQARQAGDYAQADELRRRIVKAGFTVQDSPTGPVVSQSDQPTEL